MGKPRSPDDEDERRVWTFVLDENFGTDKKKNKVPVALQGVEHLAVEMLTDHFKRGTPDHSWIPAVTEKGWVILTKDNKIRRRRIEVEAWIRAKAAVCVLRSGQMNGEKMGIALVKAMPKVRLWLAKYSRPFVVRVSSAGNPDVKFGQRRGGVRKDSLDITETVNEVVKELEAEEEEAQPPTS